MTRTSALAAATLVALALAGCTSTSAASRTSSNSPGTGTVTSPTTPSVTSSTTTAPATSAAAACAVAALHPAVARTGAALGSTYLTISLTNTGAGGCAFGGYPGVSLVGHGNGTQIGAAAVRESGYPTALVTVAPGAATTFALRVGNAANYATATCRPVQADGIRIYPPNSTTSLYLPDRSLTGCANPSVTLLSVRPIGTTP